MSRQDDKGKFSANIGQDVIEEALRSVRKHGGEQPPDAARPTEEVPIEVEGAPPEGDAAQAPTPAGDPAALAKEVEQLKAQLDFSMLKGRELMEKVKDSHERMVRATADLENYKKRAQKEKDEVTKFGSEKLLKDFLPVIDNFERALEHAKGAQDFESLLTGLKMTRKLFEDTLGRHGVKSFTAVGQLFDPRLHEAMQQTETSEVPPNTVVMEVVRGYTLNDRLIRPALVSVAKAPEKAGGAKPEAPGAAVETPDEAAKPPETES